MCLRSSRERGPERNSTPPLRSGDSNKAFVAKGSVADNINVRAIGYVRASTAEQRDSGLGLDAQRSAIAAACKTRDWALVGVEEDIASGGGADRPGLLQALAAIEAGDVDAIVCLRLDRLSRSVADFARMLERFPSSIVCLDLGIDPSTPAGEMTATVVCAMAQMERRLIGQRTREAMAQLKARGVHVGRPNSVPIEVRARIQGLHRTGRSFNSIAKLLTHEGVPTGQGGQRWRHNVVAKIAREN
jgi:DNA invertase Pin-like site-specific DNA recombinase